MSELSDRIRAAREEWVTVGGHEFLVRRPTRFQIGKTAHAPAELIFSSIVDWKLKELELVPGGRALVPPFDADSFREWIEDRIELLSELGDKIRGIIARHAEQKAEAEKN